MNYDHTYASISNGETDETVFKGQKINYSLATSQLVCQLYKVKVVLNSEQAIELELKTWEQASCDLWHSERKLRITASVIKEVCHRKASTSCTAFEQKKINPKVLYTPALCYGRAHESDAVLAYVKYQHNCRGVTVEVRECGLVVDKEPPWLAVSPDRIVIDPLEDKEKKQGGLEVKCPLSCQKMTIVQACRKVSAFYLIEEDRSTFLSISHAYFIRFKLKCMLPTADGVILVFGHHSINLLFNESIMILNL